MQYPSAPRKRVIENKFGHKIVDEYRILENPENPKVKKWVEAQNRLSDNSISKDLRKKIVGQLMQQFQFKSVGIPEKYGDFYFWRERQPKEDQGVLYIKKGLDGKKRNLIDPNALSNKDKIITLDYWSPSIKGKYLAYGMSEGGNEISKLKVMNVATGKDIETVSDNASFASMQWLPDETGFYYTGGPRAGTVPKGEERLHYKVYLHKLGKDSKRDNVIFGKGRDKEEMMSLSLSPDGVWLFITSTANWTRNDLFAYDVKNDILKPLITGLDAQFWPKATKNRVFVSTDYKAEYSRVIAANLDSLPGDIKHWQDVIPEDNNQLTFCVYSQDRILACYMVNATNIVKVFDYEGRELGKLPLPGLSSVKHISASTEEIEYFYSFDTFTLPNAINRYNPEAEKYDKYYQRKSGLDAKQYIVAQEWFKSSDGTRVPMFIIRNKTLKKSGNNSTVLYGYGGFASSITPGYLAGMAPWLEAGGVYAIANIRGGDEFGKSWHTGGILKNKQKSYDDFIAAAEHLIEQKYTSPKFLGIKGGSNGGLLVNAVSVQRPDLFKAVVSEVPLADMVRFPYFLIAGRWKSEYGDPKKKSDLENILKFSPYHNVDSSAEYPAYLLTTALNDTRVHPMHAWKMTAQLQSLLNRNPVLLHTDQSTGHMGSLTMSRFYEDRARILAFLSEQLELKI